MKIEDKINTFSKYYKSKYGFKVFKIGLSTGIECPKRATGDECIFCVRETFIDNSLSENTVPSVPVQIDYMINKMKNKVKAGGYIAYFQDGTSFYGDMEYLYNLFKEADEHPDILELNISTRPEYVSEEFLNMLCRLKKPLTIEVGVQSVNDKSLIFLNRGHSQTDNQRAIDILSRYNFRVGVHIILGMSLHSCRGNLRLSLRGTKQSSYRDEALSIAEWINSNKVINDVKIHHLAVFKGSKLEKMNYSGISLSEYIPILAYFISILRADLTISRLFTSNLNRHQTMMNDFPGVKRMWLNEFMRYCAKID